MEKYIKARDYKILIYDKEDRESYNAAIKALTEAKKNERVGQSAGRNYSERLQNTRPLPRGRLSNNHGKR